jgi:alpha-L-fucosidase
MPKSEASATCRMILVMVFALVARCTCFGQDSIEPLSKRADAVRGATPDRLAWFREAKFGMFIHWGPYSALAGEWKEKRVPVGRNAEWIMNILRIPAVEYREMAHRFNPIHFNADDWARLAKETGMRYLVLTAKHHDGFAMYHSKISPYNIVDWTPFKRDPAKELAAACARNGIRFCVYYSHREDWDDPDAYGNDWDFDVSRKNFEAYLERKSKPQLRELLTGYGPLGLIWFDRGLYTPEQALDFVRIVRSLQPDCLVNGRVGSYDQELMGDYQNMNDNGMPPGGIEEYWETPQTLNQTWGFSRFDTNWKSPEFVIRRMVEIVSKGGNYLLNIGPRGDGTIPEANVEILQRVGQWVQKNGASVYGAAASPFPDPSWGQCTVKGDHLYLHVFQWPSEGSIELTDLNNRARRASLLLEPAKRLEFSQSGSKLQIRLPQRQADPIDSIVVLEIEGTPKVDPPVVTQIEGKAIELDYLTAATAGKAVKRFNRRGQFHISKWSGPADSATWRVRFLQPGRYRAHIEYAGAPGHSGGAFLLSMGGQSLKMELVAASEWYKFVSLDLGTMSVDKSGEQAIALRPARELGQDMMYFKSLRFERLP